MADKMFGRWRNPSEPECAARYLRAPGFSMLELLIVIALFGVLATILLNRLTYYQEAAEKASMEYTVSVLKSALRSKLATLMVEGRMQESILLAQQNPMDWLDTKPENYRGQFLDTASIKIPPGSWYFNAADRTLVYRVKSSGPFRLGSGDTKNVRLKVMTAPNRSSAPRSSTMESTDTVELRVLEH